MNYSITIKSPLKIDQQTLPDWDQNLAYSEKLTATDSLVPGPYHWMVVSGHLPTNLNLNSETGAITGKPSAVGAYHFTIQATDSLDFTDTKEFTIVINSPPMIVKATFPDGIVNLAGYTQTVSATGGTGSLSFAAEPGCALPPGLALNAVNGVITGTPATTGTYTFKIVVTDSLGVSATESYTVVIHAPEPPVVTADPANATMDEGSTATFSALASGVPAPVIQWQVSTDGGNIFTNLTDADIYSGVTKDILTVAGITLDMTGFQYRAAMSNGIGAPTFSNAATLTVVYKTSYYWLAYSHAYFAYIYAFDANACVTSPAAAYMYDYVAAHFATLACSHDSAGYTSDTQNSAYYAYYYGYCWQYYAYQDFAMSDGESLDSYDAFFDGYFGMYYAFNTPAGF